MSDEINLDDFSPSLREALQRILPVGVGVALTIFTIDHEGHVVNTQIITNLTAENAAAVLSMAADKMMRGGDDIVSDLPVSRLN